MNLDLVNTVEVMRKYLYMPSPGGYTLDAILEVKKDFEALGLSTSFTKKGALIATLRGEHEDEQITISTHMDTLGAMVKDITADGHLKYTRIGGGCWSANEGENCYVITRKGEKIRGSIMFKYSSTHIYGQGKANSERNEDNMLVRLDEKIACKDDVLKLGINIGDFIAMDTRFETTNTGFIKSRYIDDKAAVAMALEICRYFRENNIMPKYTTNFFISNYEEMGHGLSNAVPCKTKELVSIDIAPVGDGQGSSEYSVTIIAKDGKTVYDFPLRNKLVNIAEDNGLDYTVDIFPHYSSDASQAVTTGTDMQFACVGPGVDASHHYERTHISAIENTLKLLINYMLSE